MKMDFLLKEIIPRENIQISRECRQTDRKTCTVEILVKGHYISVPVAVVHGRVVDDVQMRVDVGKG